MAAMQGTPKKWVSCTIEPFLPSACQTFPIAYSLHLAPAPASHSSKTSAPLKEGPPSH